MEKNPLVSIITPTYDRPDQIIESTKVIENQTYNNIEHIIVDDYSSRPVSDILEASGNTSKLTIHRHNENQGANAARNTGISLAHGDYIAFLDDDDNWEPEKLEKQIERARETNSKFVYTGVNQVNENGIFATQIPTIEGNITQEILINNPIGSFSTVLIHTDIFDAVDQLDDNLPNWQDWEFYIRASQITDIMAVPEALVNRYHHDGSQISSDYEGKRNISAPLIRKKHRSLAAEYGVEDKFEARIQRTLGATAIEASQYQEARKHYLRAIKHSPSKQDIGRLFALIGGEFTYSTARKARRNFARYIG